MTGKQLESRGLLLNMASVRTGNIQKVENKPKAEFTQSSVSSMRKRMMEEEKQSEHQVEDGTVDTSISYGLLPMPDMTGEKKRAESIANTQIDCEVKDELADLFS